jgi:hypothetical protein
MKGIRLTPFLLFVILLVVLVIAMIFGYRSNRILENMESDSGLWSVSQNASVSTYDSGASLNTILAPSSSDIPGYYFDPKTANIIVTNNVENPSFTLITRDSSGTPTIVTSQYSSNSPGAEDTSSITSMATPWTYNANNISLIYCPYQTNTFVVLIDNSSGNILTTFKNVDGSSYVLATSNLQGGAQVGIDGNADLTLYSRLGVPTKDSITMNGANINVQKIQENVYFSSEKGVIVGESGDFSDQSVSTDYKKGVSKQNNGTSNSPSTILVLSIMIDETHVLVAIIVKVDDKYQVASSNIISKSLTESSSGSDDSFSITLKTSGSDSGTTTQGGTSGSSGTGSSGSSGTNGSSSDESCSKDSSSSASKANEDIKHTCSTKSSSEASKDPEYIRKTEIVPPVCPACPTTNCPISVNDQGEIVDCTGKKVDLGQLAGVQGANGYSSAPASYEGTIAGAIGDTATAVGDTAQTGLKEVGDTLQTGLQSAAPVASDAVNTVGDVAEKGLDTAGGALDSAIGGAENIVGQVGSGLGSLGKGVADTVTGVSSDVTGLAKDVVGETGDLIGGAGTGLKELAEGNQDLQSQQMRQDFVQEMSQQQQGQMGQQQQGQMGQQQGQMGQQQGQMGYGYGYGQQQMGYNYGQPQQCNYCPQPGQGYSYPRACSSNFMPITNDFSQFT